MTQNSIPRSPKENPFLIQVPEELKKMNVNGLMIKVAETQEEVMQAQSLRYQVFYDEYGADPIKDMAEVKRDYDSFDDVSTHLLVIDTNSKDGDEVIGTYRMFLQDVTEEGGANLHPFYTETEFDISKLKKKGNRLMEVGRSCIKDGYRTRFAIQLLWQGIGAFIFAHNVDFLFGCASFEGYVDPQELALPLSYLHHFHLAREEIRPETLPDLFHSIDLMPKEEINPKEALKFLPPLVKGYLRLNGVIGEGAMVDNQWNSVDVCIMVETASLSAKHVDYYRRDRS